MGRSDGCVIGYMHIQTETFASTGQNTPGLLGMVWILIISIEQDILRQ